ncbi:hypothetical protein NADFUDRAFT_43658 [Nadsonia fulvescens var. elongata DSM 6958]|uniref:Uncharacterized protein n=1 Tax=Nadsonia fulvescens var. elongata DSM 6958 TaxID=857566 RepID=A0A1E3PF74_9ASCO|nr:hypothetical protein NADFUDRAFT_43658 [Nadsonia fulvescens var. elongata DSM 6958]
MHSIALSTQTVWTIRAYYKFEQFMDNLMNLIGYWLAIYQSISLSEHSIYRKGKLENYEIESWEDPDVLPISISALFAFACSCAGAAVGMSQVWWIGPIAKMIDNGGDISFELCFCFSAIGYNLLRFWELKYIGR